jgi:hypothetical protein
MVKISVLIFASFFILKNTLAQKRNVVDKMTSVTVAFGNGAISSAFGYQHLWLAGKKKKLGIGTGVRFTNYFGNNQYYTTAPAKLTTGKTGPGVLFAEDILQNIDSVLFKKSQLNALNLSVNFIYAISNKITVGFNIDALGFTLGSKQNGVYYGNNGIGATTAAKPAGFNLLLVSDNDKGTLNSELYVQYYIKSKWAIKSGFQYLFTEYVTSANVQTTADGQKNDRFRNKSSAISIGLTYKF